jgi:glycosyltransferase involved in cell wall biosynthesis
MAFLGRLAPHKRPVQLVESFATWTAPLAPARLELHGPDLDGEGEVLRRTIARLQVEGNVRLCGHFAPTDLPRILENTDVVVLPSQYEGLPLVLVEAMQRGIPIVATSAGGIAELGADNPDVRVTPGTGWPEFERGMYQMAQALRAGEIDARRLHAWTEARYGYAAVAAAWRSELLDTQPQPSASRRSSSEQPSSRAAA